MPMWSPSGLFRKRSLLQVGRLKRDGSGKIVSPTDRRLLLTHVVEVVEYTETPSTPLVRQCLSKVNWP